MPARTLLVDLSPGPASPALATALRERLREVAADEAVELEHVGDVRDAAARANAAVRTAGADRVVLLRDASPDGAALAATVIRTQRDRGGLVLGGAARLLEDWRRPTDRDDFASTLAKASARVFAHGETIDLLPDVPALAIDGKAFLAIGGLDERLDGVGEAQDLALRALEAGLPVELCPPVGPPRTGDSRPSRALLMWRNAALLALRQPSAIRAGALLGHVATLAIATAWRAAGLDPDALRFGGAWAQQSPLDRLLGRTGVARNATFWPRDEVASLVPLLGLDAALEQGPSGGWSARATSHVGPRAGASPSDPADASPTDNAERETSAAGTPREPPPAMRPPGDPVPLVSVIVVNWNGEEHLDACFGSLATSDWPAGRLELICVDNGSTDGSRARLAARFPAVRLVALDENRGFTGGNNAGVAAARGDVLVFLNNDMRVEPDAVRRLVEAIDARHPCTAARVLSWDGRRIDFVRGTISFEARGYQEHYGEAVRPELSAAGESFFPNGGAFAITREAYARAGGFDDRYFAYYDDIDLGWGVRLAGGHVRVVPDAVVYHRHGATSNRQPRGQKQFLMERNAVWTAVKRYGDPALRHALGAMLALAARRIVQQCDFARGPAARELAAWSRRLPGPPIDRGGPRAGAAGGGLLTRCPVESLAAAGEALRALPQVVDDRQRLATRRTVTDEEVLPHMGRALESLSSHASYTKAHEALVARLDLARVFRQRTRVLVVTHEPLRPNMSGPGVRALEMGRALSASCRVTLATPFPPEIADDRFRLAQYAYTSQASLRVLAEDADVVILQGFTLKRFPFLSRLPARLVVDLYCPFTIEHLEMRTSAIAAGVAGAMPLGETLAEAAAVLEAQNEQLAAGDFFLCASERQRDFWIGALQTAGRVNARTYGADPTLRSLIDVVPFGVPDDPPPPARPAIRGVLAGVDEHDRVLLWAGSILDWQDPQLLVRAVAALAARRPDVKLVFMGTRHPNPDVPPMRAVEETIAVARELGVADRHVFFNGWVPYADRHAWLLDADLGVSTHGDHLETRLSFRTRMLDYIWAGLPIVCTQGDVFAEWVESRGLGLTVPPGDVVALTTAIDRLLDDDERRDRCRAELGRLAAELRWREVTRPLRRFCASPAFAADREPGMRAVRTRLEQKYRVSKWLKRTALELGVSEGLIERVKQAEPVRSALVWRNRVAVARAQRGK